MLNIIILFLFLFNQVLSAPLPRVITRYHTADAVTNTQTVTTGTTTVYLPPVEIFISNGVTYTFTLTEQAATIPTTFTSYFDTEENQVMPTTETAAAAEAQTTSPEEAVPTTISSTEVAQTNEAEQTTEVAQTTTSSTEAAQTNDTEQTTEGEQTTEAAQITEVEQTTEAQQATEAAQTTTSSTEAEQTTDNQTTDDIATTSTTSTDSETTTSTGSGDSTGLVTGTLSPPEAIVYSPYTDDGSCKDTSTIQSDLDYIYSLGINKIRLYGTDCGTFTAVLPYCEEKGIKVNQGLWFSSAGVDSIDDGLNDIVSYGQENGWDVFEFITVGNEAISDGYVTANELISKISSVKSTLDDAGYSGELTTSEPASSFVSNPSLCADSDITFVGINAHSYFDEYVNASQAGTFILGQIEIVANVCGSKDVVVTETGYPSKGDIYGLNVPSEANQKIAIESIIESMNGKITILTTFNDLWKNPGPHGIEQYFGAAHLFD